MTINHLFLPLLTTQIPLLRPFYRALLAPLGYRELIVARNETLIGYGSDYPYFWIQGVDLNSKEEGGVKIKFLAGHVAFDAKDREAVDGFYSAALEAGATDNGPPGIRKEMSRQPYYAAFVKDLAGNNIEAVCVVK